jgi:hypothetical protein
MKTLHKSFAKEPTPLFIVYDTENDKMLCINQEKFNYDDKTLKIVFTLTSYLIGMLRTLNIPFYKVKKRILSAINKDLSNGKSFDINSNLYNVLVNEFGIRTA